MSAGFDYGDENWTVITGCTHSGSPGCDNCYAKAEHDRRHKAYLAGKKMPRQYAHPFSKIQFHEDRLDWPLHWLKPRRVLVCFTGDWMHPDVSTGRAREILHAMGKASRHTFFTLTKRPQRLAEKFGRGSGCGILETDYPNVINGVTVCNQAEADAKIPELLKVPGRRWISLEPMLGPVDLCNADGNDSLSARTDEFWNGVDALRPQTLDWVAIGCESGPKRRPCRLEWILDVVQQCKAARLPCYVKQVPVPKTKLFFARDDTYFEEDKPWPISPAVWDYLCQQDGWRVSHDVSEWPEPLRVREMPE